MNILINVIAKLILKISKLLGIGSGSTWPGHVALKLNPNILGWYSRKVTKGIVLIVGTNGKTTTSNLISHALNKLNKSVITNQDGANMENGIVSAFVRKSGLFGNKTFDYAVFEVDELNLFSVSKRTNPKIIIFLNLSRDQLDRYAEIEVILKNWSDTARDLKNTRFLVYQDDSNLKKLNLPTSRAETFNKDSYNLNVHYLFGDFNKINVNAAVTALKHLTKETQFDNIFEDFEPVFGRGEEIEYKNNNIRVFLSKNPASFNNNLGMLGGLLTTYPQSKNKLLVVLNDNIADGRDISWIYDIDSDLIKMVDKMVDEWVCMGKRGLDFANRLKYAEVSKNKVKVIDNFESLDIYLSETQGVIFWVLPTYTGMLNFRAFLRKSNLGRTIRE